MVRDLGVLTESLHAVVYFAPEPQEEYAELGLRGYWRGYFASRAAPLGRASAQLVEAVFGGFAPGMVAKAVPGVWDLAQPVDVAAARSSGAVAALGRLIGDIDVEVAASLTSEVVATLTFAGRPMAAAQASLARPDEPLAALWHDCTVLREHRGDGHLAVLAASGLRWPEPHVLLVSLGVVDEHQQRYRGWSDEEWRTAADRLESQGLLGTEAGSELVEAIEAGTDRLAAHAYQDVDTRRLHDHLVPLAKAASAGLPFPNAMGLHRLS